jgi:protocatechuate 3,4-dioxygenase alpha subunit
MSNGPRRLGQTPSQTVGPYFAYGLTPEQYGYGQDSLTGTIVLASIAMPEMRDEATPGTPIRIEGRVLDGAGVPITDAMIEIWQADASGHYVGAGQPKATNTRFTGFGRCGTGTDPEARFWFETIKPGVVSPGEAPHIDITVMMRGLLLHAFTRAYFSDEAANATDPVLLSVPAERRGTLVAIREAPGLYRFDIHMQGENETVFFDL